MLTGGKKFLRRAERLPQNRRLRPLRWIEIPVATTQREVIRFTHNRHRQNFNRIAKIAHHPRDDGQLLKIFLTKCGDVWLDDVEKFCDDGANAPEVTGTPFAFQPFGERSFLHPRRSGVTGVHLSVQRREDNIHGFTGAKRGIGLDVTRIPVEIFLRTELRRIHVNTHHRRGITGARPAHQRGMASVQRTHRRHQREPATRPFESRRRCLHLGDVTNDFHAGKL